MNSRANESEATPSTRFSDLKCSVGLVSFEGDLRVEKGSKPVGFMSVQGHFRVGLGAIFSGVFGLTPCQSSVPVLKQKKARAFPTLRTLFCGALLLFSTLPLAAAPVTDARVPEGGIQPQLAIQGQNLHLIYFKGDVNAGDIFYTHSTDEGVTWSKPLRVNSQAASVIAIGTVRGPRLAVGKAGRVHVAWMGSKDAAPKAPGATTPMLYARLNDAADAFEPQRNLITSKPGLDGGGAVAADDAGNVFVAWHAPLAPGGDETTRRVFIARSKDEGKSFAPEAPASADATGACGCCGMQMFAEPSGAILALYRAAGEKINRDMYLLRSDNHGETFKATRIAPMRSNMCMMSTEAITTGASRDIIAWETDGQIYFSRVDTKTHAISEPVAMPGPSKTRKHPAVAISPDGKILIAWTEGTGWNRDGALAWQEFDATGKPIEGAAGRLPDGIPAWSVPAAFVKADGTFTVLH